MVKYIITLLTLTTVNLSLIASEKLKGIQNELKNNHCLEVNRFRIIKKIEKGLYEIKFKKAVFSQRGWAWSKGLLKTKNTQFSSAGIVYQTLAVEDLGMDEMKLSNGFTHKVAVWDESPRCLGWFALRDAEIKEVRNKEIAVRKNKAVKSKERIKAQELKRKAKKEKFNALYE